MIVWGFELESLPAKSGPFFFSIKVCPGGHGPQSKGRSFQSPKCLRVGHAQWRRVPK